MSSRPALAVAVLLLSTTVPATAAVHVWTGAASDRFSDAANWRGGSPAGDPAAELSFPAGAARLVATNDIASLTVKTIAFSGAGYVIGGNPIAIAAGGEVTDTTDGPNAIGCDLQLAGGANVFTQNNIFGLADGVTVSGSIGGVGPLVKLGEGRLTFTGSRPNTYSGETRVLNGELRLGKADGVNAVPGDLVVDTTGVNDEYGSLATLTSEQIPDSAKIRVGHTPARIGVAAIETIGPIQVEGGSWISTFHGYSGNSSGTIILAGDIDVVGNSSNDARFYGDFALSGIRAVTTHGNTAVELSFLHDHIPGSGLIIRRKPDTFGSVEVLRATYYGPTVIESGYAIIDNPNTAVRLRGGTFRGSVASLVAEGGMIDATAFAAGVKTAGDLRLSGATKLHLSFHSSEPKITAGGTLDLHRAVLDVSIDGNLQSVRGATHLIAANNGPGPILGTFFDVPEGHVVLNRFRVSYKGGDGNDLTLTNVGRYYTTTRVSADPSRVVSGGSVKLTASVSSQTSVNGGNVTFRNGHTVIGTVPVSGGNASITFQPPLGNRVYTATYEGTADLAPSTGEVRVEVTPAPAQITSVTPDTFPGGTMVDGIIQGTGFLPGGKVVTTTTIITPTSVTPTEVRFRWNVPRYEQDNPMTLSYQQPPPGSVDSNRVPIVVKAAPLPKTKLTFEPRAITGPVVPGGSAAWLAIAMRDRFGAPAFEHRAAITPDSDRDGIARWEQTQDVAPSGLWVMTDMSDGTILSGTRSGSAPPPDEFPKALFLRDDKGNYSHGMLNRFADAGTGLLWIRRGLGAWYLNIEDGAGGDLDGAFNDYGVFNTSQMQPIDGTPAPPAGVQPGDVLVGMDFVFMFGSWRLAWFGDRVDDHLRESDGPGTLRLVPLPLGPVQESAGTVLVKVLRVGGTDGTISVNYQTEDDTARSGAQYAGRAGTLTFGSGEILKTIEIPLIDNSAYSGEAAFNVVLSNPAGTTIGGGPILKVRIRDNDQAPQLTAENVTVTEGDEGEHEVRFPVTLSGPASVPVTATWGWGNDLGTLTFVPGGPLTQTIVVRYTGNRIPEENRHIGVRLFDITNALPDRIDRTVTIVDDDFHEITVLDATANESKSSANVIVAITGGTYKPVTVSYATANGSATAGEDFTAKSGTLTFGRTFSRAHVTVPITADTNAEGDEWFTLVLSDVKNATLRRTAATIVIVDDDATAPPVPSITMGPVFVTESSTNSATFRLRLSFAARSEIRVRAATVAGTAGDGDFTPVSQTVVIPKDAEEAYVRVNMLNDFTVEGPETFSLVLSEPAGVTIATPAAIATIFDDDEVRQDPTAITVAVSGGASVIEGSSGHVPARFTVQLSRASSSPVTVPFATADAGAVAPADYVAASGTLTFAPGETSKTIDVQVVSDREYEADETFSLVLGDALNAWTTTRAATARIVNDDEQLPSHRRSVRH